MAPQEGFQVKEQAAMKARDDIIKLRLTKGRNGLEEAETGQTASVLNRALSVDEIPMAEFLVPFYFFFFIIFNIFPNVF